MTFDAEYKLFYAGMKAPGGVSAHCQFLESCFTGRGDRLFARRSAVLTEGTRGRGRRVRPNGIMSSLPPMRLIKTSSCESSCDCIGVH